MTIRFDAALHGPPLLERGTVRVGRFRAMGTPCEILIDDPDPSLGRRLLAAAQREAARIEEKFSRYRPGNTVDLINKSAGQEIEVDRETADLLDFAAKSWQISEGLFDITTGVLRHAWRFDGQSRPAQRERVGALLPFVGWDKVAWKRPNLVLPAGMEIDLGGICKEYAADRVLNLLSLESEAGLLVNLGGDIAVRGTRPWNLGIEDVNQPGEAARTMEMKVGALATSGDRKRFTVIDGRRYGHILDPRTGWPVVDPPASVTVAASTCTEAGFFSTLAMLHGPGAEEFLEQQDVQFWCYR